MRTAPSTKEEPQRRRLLPLPLSLPLLAPPSSSRHVRIVPAIIIANSSTIVSFNAARLYFFFFFLLFVVAMTPSPDAAAAAAALGLSEASAGVTVASGPSDGRIGNIVIVIAMEAEARPLIDHLQLEHDDGYFPPHTPFQAWNGTYNTHHQVTVVTNGKDTVYRTDVDNCGTVPAAMVSFLALQRSTYDLLLNAGTCGGFKRKGAEIGDVFLTTAVAHHDRRIPIPGFDAYGVGHLPTTFNPNALAAELGFKTGICTTGNSLDKTPEDDQHMLTNDASVKDMEAAAIAWSCHLHRVPFLGVKVVTDIVDGDRPTHEEFMENLHTASSSLQSALPQVLDYLLGKHHDEL